MAVDLKRDWPVAAIAAAGLVGAYLLTKQTSGVQPIVTGGDGDGAGYAAALQAQTQISTAELAAKRDIFTALIGGYSSVQQARLSADVRMAEIKSESATAAAQIAAQRQKTELGFLGGLFSAIFGFFSWETTQTAIANRSIGLPYPSRRYGPRFTLPRIPWQPFVWGKYAEVRG